MIAYYCENCDCAFEETAWEYDEFGEYRVCPECGSDCVEEAGECAICGIPIDPNKKLCESCEADLDVIISRAVADVKHNYKWLTAEQAADILFDYCEGRGFSRMFRKEEK